MKIYFLWLTFFSFPAIILLARDVAQLVARLVWDQDVAGSNPVIPTNKRADGLSVGSFVVRTIGRRRCDAVLRLRSHRKYGTRRLRRVQILS